MGSQMKWEVLLKILRIAGGLSQEELAEGFPADQAFASRVETAKTVITPDIIARWVGICGGRKALDDLIRQLRALRSFLDAMLEPVLLQA